LVGNKKILITGGAGFISWHLVRYFLSNYANYQIYNLGELKNNFEFIN
jgi:nucleoside-diphosphate-sugar epimerase